MFMQSLNEQIAMQERERERKQTAVQSLQEQTPVQMAMQSPQEGKGYTLISQDVNEAANRLNLLCGSVSAGNHNRMLKNEISMICDHLYKQKVLKKPELKKIVKRYCM
jgi:hypothetical protein